VAFFEESTATKRRSFEGYNFMGLKQGITVQIFVQVGYTGAQRSGLDDTRILAARWRQSDCFDKNFAFRS
jgi:hypothetical protein